VKRHCQPCVFAFEDGEKDWELEGVNDADDGVELFRIPFVAAAEADHQAVGCVLDLSGGHDNLKLI
jgi:hypothetical protein